MSHAIQFDPKRLPPEAEALRVEVRDFLRQEIESGTFDPHDAASESRFNREFSQRVGAKGWIGMTWPKKYGGQEKSYLERYVMNEEFLLARAPTRAHFTGDRQSGPVLMKYAQDHIKEEILPKICRGDVTFCIGMSEPDSGSDLFAAKTRAERVGDHWHVNGRKLWTSGAHNADYMIGLFRTQASTSDNRRHGLTQFLVPLKTTEGITIRPVINATGRHDFNEVIFEDAVLPADHQLGEVHSAWKQATSELAYERSGSERFLETVLVLIELVRAMGESPAPRDAAGLGKLIAQLHSLRRMSLSVAGMLAEGKEPVVEGSIVKDLGTNWEQALPDRARDLASFLDTAPNMRGGLEAELAFATIIAPKLTIQGGTREVLRGIIARGLGLR